MPIFEYSCQQCEHRFEQLVMGDAAPFCPKCHSQKLSPQLSVFAVSGKGASAASDVPSGACHTCGDPRGPGSCSLPDYD